jgi:hypothetical protein
MTKDQEKRNNERIQVAEKTITAYARTKYGARHAALDEPETQLVDLLTDLMHWSREYGVIFDRARSVAMNHYGEDIREQSEPQ